LFQDIWFEFVDIVKQILTSQNISKIKISSPLSLFFNVLKLFANTLFLILKGVAIDDFTNLSFMFQKVKI